MAARKRTVKKQRKSRSTRPDRRLSVLVVLGCVGLGLVYLGGRGEEMGIDGEPLTISTVVRIEVRNGCGVKDVAAGIRKELIDLGHRTGIEIDVVGTENADDFLYDETVLVDLRNDERRTRRLAKLIGCDLVVRSEDLDAYPDYRLIVGMDHGDLKWKR